MGNYNLPKVIYRGYVVTIDQFNHIMKQIPDYKKLMDDYGEHNYILCYMQWKHAYLAEKLRSRAPKVIERWAPGADKRKEPTHVILPASYVPVDHPDKVENPQILEETDRDRQVREIFLKFFRRRGVADLNADHFQYAWCIGENPELVTT